MELITPVDLKLVEQSSFNMHLADCVVLTHDGYLLLQQRTASWGKSAGFLTLFGGHVDPGETIMEALVRELHEELGAIVSPTDVTLIGAISEAETQHTELVHIHFWHDKDATITGCYEAEPVYYKNVAGVLAHPKIMDYVVWALNECINKNLIG